MQKQKTLTVHPKTKEEFDALKAFMKALKIKFEVSKESPYNPEFVEKILQGKRDIEEGKGVSFSMEEIKELCK
ncbi:MAG TPA: DUF2683 family protein [Flavobacteriaceae bacterium]|nr:DUF2683 family protein [Flavobacteriaceae bacterium]